MRSCSIATILKDTCWPSVQAVVLLVGNEDALLHHWSQMLGLSMALGIMLIAGGVVMFFARKMVSKPPEPPATDGTGFSLSEINRMHREGLIDDQERDRAKTRLADASRAFLQNAQTPRLSDIAHERRSKAAEAAERARQHALRAGLAQTNSNAQPDAKAVATQATGDEPHPPAPASAPSATPLD